MDEQHLDALPPVNVSVPQGGQVGPAENTRSKTEQQAMQAAQQPPSGFVDPSALGPLPLGSASVPPDNSALGAQSTSVTPPIADDADLIEKEWVEKAKQIVEHTKSDPHKQNEAITKMKLDYLKKRYNRDIKVSED